MIKKKVGRPKTKNPISSTIEYRRAQVTKSYHKNQEQVVMQRFMYRVLLILFDEELFRKDERVKGREYYQKNRIHLIMFQQLNALYIGGSNARRERYYREKYGSMASVAKVTHKLKREIFDEKNKKQSKGKGKKQSSSR